MSSHREAPEISTDPAADNTDVYAFVSPDAPDTVTLIANFIPFELPYGGPNFNEFNDNILYEIKISNAGDAQADISYQFRFTTTIRNPNTFLYNIGPITSVTDTTWNRPQTYSVTKVVRGSNNPQVIGTKLPVPPVNVGARSTPQYEALAAQGISTVNGRKFFAGQRADGFHVDLGSIFDLGGLRPLNANHAFPLQNMPGVNGLQGLNVHTIAIQVPKTDLIRAGAAGTSVADAGSVIGVWATASRSRGRIFNASTGKYSNYGDFAQVSRLGIPLFNEVLTPMAKKDYWNSQQPSADSQFAQYVLHPELAGLLPVLYPGAFPNLAAYTKARADLAAIILTGIPTGVVPGFQNFTGATQADMLRLNVAVPPTRKPNPIGLVAGDAAGFPNGRRVFDDVVTIELQAIAGLTIPLVDPTFTPDAVVPSVTDGTKPTNGAVTKPTKPTDNYLTSFPYLNTPLSGYTTAPGRPFAITANPPA